MHNFPQIEIFFDASFSRNIDCSTQDLPSGSPNTSVHLFLLDSVRELLLFSISVRCVVKPTFPQELYFPGHQQRSALQLFSKFTQKQVDIFRSYAQISSQAMKLYCSYQASNDSMDAFRFMKSYTILILESCPAL